MRLLLAHESETGVLRLVDEDEGTPPLSLSEPSHQYPTPLTTPSLGLDSYRKARPEGAVMTNIGRTSAQNHAEKVMRKPTGAHAEKGSVKILIGENDVHQLDNREVITSSGTTQTVHTGMNTYTPNSEVSVQSSSCVSGRLTMANFGSSVSLSSQTIRGVRNWLRVRRPLAFGETEKIIHFHLPI